jgi:transposase-like protein
LRVLSHQPAFDYAPELMEQARKVMKSSADSWRMDETYIKVKGGWFYRYRAVDRFGNTIDLFSIPS